MTGRSDSTSSALGGSRKRKLEDASVSSSERPAVLRCDIDGNALPDSYSPDFPELVFASVQMSKIPVDRFLSQARDVSVVGLPRTTASGEKNFWMTLDSNLHCYLSVHSASCPLPFYDAGYDQ